MSSLLGFVGNYLWSVNDQIWKGEVMGLLLREGKDDTWSMKRESEDCRNYF